MESHTDRPKYEPFFQFTLNVIYDVKDGKLDPVVAMNEIDGHYKRQSRAVDDERQRSMLNSNVLSKPNKNAMADIIKRLDKHVEAEFSPDWAEKAASIMKQASSLLTRLKDDKVPSVSISCHSEPNDTTGWYYRIDEGEEVGPFESYDDANDNAYAKNPSLPRRPRIFIGSVVEHWQNWGNGKLGDVDGDIHFDDENEERLFSVIIGEKWITLDRKSSEFLLNRIIDNS